MFLSTGNHGKTRWLVLVLEPRVFLELNLCWKPLNNFEVSQPKLAMISPTPAVELVTNVYDNYLDV